MNIAPTGHGDDLLFTGCGLGDVLKLIDSERFRPVKVSSPRRSGIEMTIRWVFRGQSNVDWRLEPGIYREQEFEKLEESILGRWVQRNSDKVHFNALDHMAEAQHWGVPTRLLDWTYQFVVALYFATRSCRDKDGVVHCILPAKQLLTQVDPVKQLKSSQDVESLLRHSYTYPVFFEPKFGAKRQKAQNALFSFHSKGLSGVSSWDLWNVDTGQTLDSRIKDCIVSSVAFRVLIPSGKKPAIRRALVRSGVNCETLFPDSSGLAEYLRDELSIELGDIEFGSEFPSRKFKSVSYPR